MRSGFLFKNIIIYVYHNFLVWRDLVKGEEFYLLTVRRETIIVKQGSVSFAHFSIFVRIYCLNLFEYYRNIYWSLIHRL